MHNKNIWRFNVNNHVLLLLIKYICNFIQTHCQLIFVFITNYNIPCSVPCQQYCNVFWYYSSMGSDTSSEILKYKSKSVLKPSLILPEKKTVSSVKKHFHLIYSWRIIFTIAFALLFFYGWCLTREKLDTRVKKEEERSTVRDNQIKCSTCFIKLFA